MKVFLSYRRDDARHLAERIYKQLATHLGSESVFKDVDSVPLGSDFRKVIEDAVKQCDVLLVVIGEKWLDIRTAGGQRRLNDPNDFVRLEIEAALSREIPVIPVVADQAMIPRPEDLPDSLEQLAYRQSAVVRPDPDFDRDMDRLTHSLSRMLPRRSRPLKPSTTPKLRYYCYISRSKVKQLRDQLQSTTSDSGNVQDSWQPDTSIASFFETLRYGGRGRASDVGGAESVVQSLYTVLEHIENHEKVMDLAKLCKDKAGVILDAFCYAYRGKFYNLGDIGRDRDSGIHISGVALQRSGDDIVLSKSLLIEPARTENAIREVGPNKSNVVSNMCIICSEVEEYTLRLACSYKFFSDMGGSWHEREGEWSVHPHSGNHHFFAGEVDAWFETLVFVNGIRGNTILGTPLFLVHSVDPELTL